MFPSVVLSSDEEEEEADNASTGSVNRLDSVSPRPADSAHSSPAPSGGRVEAAVKSVAEEEEVNLDFFEEMVSTKITIPRRARMKDQVRRGGMFFGARPIPPVASPQITDAFPSFLPQFGNQPPEQFSPRTKKPKIESSLCDSIILECRSVRVGSLRRMVTKPVVVSLSSFYRNVVFSLGIRIS